jgi:hypothetical protein
MLIDEIDRTDAGPVREHTRARRRGTHLFHRPLQVAAPRSAPTTRLQPPGPSAVPRISEPFLGRHGPKYPRASGPRALPVIGIAIAALCLSPFAQTQPRLECGGDAHVVLLGKHAELQHPAACTEGGGGTSPRSCATPAAIASGKGAASWAEPLRAHPRRARRRPGHCLWPRRASSTRTYSRAWPTRTPLHNEREPVGPDALAGSTVPASAPRRATRTEEIGRIAAEAQAATGRKATATATEFRSSAGRIR